MYDEIKVYQVQHQTNSEKTNKYSKFRIEFWDWEWNVMGLRHFLDRAIYVPIITAPGPA